MTIEQMKKLFLRLSPSAGSLAYFMNSHRTGPILFSRNHCELLQIPFQLNGERTNKRVHRRPFWLQFNSQKNHRKFSELLFSVYVGVLCDGLSLDLLVVLEEEKDSWVR